MQREVDWDAVNRRLLDFDFEKLCSVTLASTNVYACLECGGYFQGRQPGTPAHLHALHTSHQRFLALKSLKAYLMPDGLAVEDGGALDDVRAVLRPRFDKLDMERLDEQDGEVSVDLHKKTFVPGFIGLNNLKANDYVNVIVQALAHIMPLRDALLPTDDRELKTASPMLGALRDLFRKLWNPIRFKAQTSPHEFMQVVGTASGRRFNSSSPGDPVDFLLWLLTQCTHDSPLMASLFQGRVQVDEYRLKDHQPPEPVQGSEKPFWLLALDLPAAPIFNAPSSDSRRHQPPPPPQVALASLVQDKFDGGRLVPNAGRAASATIYTLRSHPRHLILHLRRFTRTAFGIEHNDQTVVTFSPDAPLRVPADPSSNAADPQYRLIANVYIISRATNDAGGDLSMPKPTDESPACHAYGIHVLCRATGQWFEIENLSINPVHPQMLFLAESYLQFWERI